MSSEARDGRVRIPREEDHLQYLNTRAALRATLAQRESLALTLATAAEVVEQQRRSSWATVSSRQQALLETHLLPPFDGHIAAIYKDLGEYCAAGEPVLRIDDDSSVFLVGIVQHRQPLAIGARVEIVSQNAFDSTSTLTVSGSLAAVRGHTADDDEWDIVILVPNAGHRLVGPTGTRLIRLTANFQFDPESTTFNLLPPT